MSAISLKGNAGGTGTLSIAAPSTNTNQTLTLPDNTGTLLSTASTFSGTGPAFSAYLTSAQGFANSSFAQMVGWTENFDTNNNFTSNRFTPTVAGYYQINGQVAMGGASTGYTQIAIYKNNVQYSTGSTMINNTSTGAMCMVSDVIYLNGSTDYVELWAWQNSGSSLATQANTTINKFSGALVRNA